MNTKPLLHPLVATLTLTVIAVTTCLADTTSLGRFSLSTLSAPSLKTTTPLRSSVRSFRFVGKVGGVAFDALAQPERGLTVKSLALNYDAAEPDGRRLKVVINGKPAVAEIYDWELLPISRYAASNSTSCFTLFGELDDKEKAEELRQKNDRILNYDEAFKDTLVGFRLFQLDVLVMDEEFGTDLPKVNGQYLLGAGEQAPDLSKARDLMREYFASREDLQRRADSDENGFPTKFQSYVICDQTVDLRFGVVDSRLALTGAPFYYFWTEERTDQTALLNRAMLKAARKAGVIGPKDTVERLEARHKVAKARSDAVFLNLFLAEAKKAGLIPETAGADDLDEKLSHANEKLELETAAVRMDAAKYLGLARPDDDWNALRRRLFESLTSGTPEQRNATEAKLRELHTETEKRLSTEGIAAKQLTEKVKSLTPVVEERMRVEGGTEYALIKEIQATREAAEKEIQSGAFDDGRKVTYLDKFSEEHVALAAKLAEANPAVWRAGEKTMRYSAFFRYCKKRFPAAWKKFTGQLQKADPPQPTVTTPTVMTLPSR